MALRSNWDGFIRLNLISVPVRAYSANVPARGKIGQEPYAMLQQVMADQNRQAIARVIFAGREELVLLRPIERLIAMTMLSYDSQIKRPTSFEDEVPKRPVSAKELKLAESLVEASTTDELNYALFHDTYTSHVKKLIEAKAEGKRIMIPKPQEEPQIINLMDALRRSLNEARKGTGKTKARDASERHAKRRKTG
jgi:DNA end-binding protein Ku